jgi:hypothetical protein
MIAPRAHLSQNIYKKPDTLNPQFHKFTPYYNPSKPMRLYTLHPTPYTLHPTPYTLHPTPYTLHPTFYPPRTTPYTLHPTPYTLHPTLCTPHSTPYTLHYVSHQLLAPARHDFSISGSKISVPYKTGWGIEAGRCRRLNAGQG